MAIDVKTDIQLDQIIAAHAGCEGALLPILHDVQAALGHVSEASIRTIAHALNLSRAEVHGVVSFYHDFHENPDPRPVLKLCRAEACQARGVEALAAALPQQDRVRSKLSIALACAVSGLTRWSGIGFTPASTARGSTRWWSNWHDNCPYRR